MKNQFFILFLMAYGFLQAQIVHIPDPSFKDALINTNCVDTDNNGSGDADADTNNDGEIQLSEAEAVLRLYVDSANIASLEGIQRFINLETLSCPNNQLTSLDLSQNHNLAALFCNNNQLTDLDITGNPNLEVLYCNSNQLTHLNVTQNPNIWYLYCSNNLLTSLDVTQNPNLGTLLCSYNPLTTLDVSQNPNLFSIRCNNNGLSNLDVSQNLNLSVLLCNNNQLTHLDVSQNSNLLTLSCHDNQLTGLNIKNGNNSNLTRMMAYSNPRLECILVDDEAAAYPACDLNINYGWCTDEGVIYSEDCTLGVKDYNATTISIQPNPVRQTLSIISDMTMDNIEIFSIQGERVAETIEREINVSQIAPGVYFALITVGEKNITKKFIKK